MRFSKWHALGNDYLLVERAETGHALARDTASRLCDYHRGIGADGILEITAAAGHRAEVVIWNPDGSIAEVSGNGTRIAAVWLARRLSIDAVVIAVGAREIRARLRDDGLVEQEMGRADVGTPEEIEVAGAPLTVVPVSVGNPHAVIERLPDRDSLLGLGPLVEHHPRFPERTNVQLVRVDDHQSITVRVWERGAGETLSSGTSACAAAAAMVAAGRCRSPVTVHLPGGDLEVSVDELGNALLTGPAQEICRGELAADLLVELGL
jgi:diaminopimelate epimerase